ncbi:MAG: hypothetical protein WD336_07560, partial [Trueperaceae bacterium]
LYLLTRYGARPRPARFYADRYLRAVPEAEAAFARSDAPRSDLQAGIVRDLYAHTLLLRFAWFFGLLEAREPERVPGTPQRASDVIVTATPLLRDLVGFPVGGGGDGPVATV